MQYLQASTTVRGVFLLLLATALLSLAGCGGGGGKGGGAAATISAISAGSSHTCAIVKDKAWCWGDNTEGQLGVGDDSVTDSNFPVAVVQTPADADAVPATDAVLLDSGVSAISAGRLHTCAIHNTADEGETEVLAAKCWGFGGNGRLGNGDTDNSPIPVQVTGLVSGVSAISAAVGSTANHTCAIHSGAAKCWGFGDNGRLGNGSATQSTTPVQVTDLGSGVTVISAGNAHTCAVHSGAAKCWGFGDNGRLGNDSATQSNTPVQVTDLGSGVTAISAGSAHTCAVHSGAAKCWGSGNDGRLGNGSETESTTPVQVTGLTSQVTAISAGSTHTCAVHGGAAKCWGGHNLGWLGDSGNTNSNIPVQVTGLTSQVTAISAGEFHACALHNDAAKCWGFNANGQLGVGELADGDDDDTEPDTTAFTPQTVSFE